MIEADLSNDGGIDDGFRPHSMDDPLPEDLHLIPQPELFRLIVQPVTGPKKTASGIYLPDQAIEAAGYLSQLARVIAIGEGCFKGAHISRLETSLAERIKPGAYVIFSGRAPQKFTWNENRFYVIHDDWIVATVKPSEVPNLKWYG